MLIEILKSFLHIYLVQEYFEYLVLGLCNLCFDKPVIFITIFKLPVFIKLNYVQRECGPLKTT